MCSGNGGKVPPGPEEEPLGVPMKFLGADGSLRLSPTKACPLTSRNEKEGPKLENVLKEWGERALGDPAEEPLGVPMEFVVQTIPCGRERLSLDIEARVVHYRYGLYDKY